MEINNLVIFTVVAVIVIVGTLVALMKRYKRCSSDQLLVVYGKTGSQSSAKVIHGGGKFVFPVIQDYAYIDLKPMALDIKLVGALTSQNIRIAVPSTFTVSVSSDIEDRGTAAEKLLNLDRKAISGLAENIILGGLRMVIASMRIEDINADRDKFLSSIQNTIENELKKIGIRLINVNITDITDESGYINALGKEAASKAINDAKVSVSKIERDGSVGQSTAQKDQRIRLAELDADTVVGEAENQARKNIGTAESQKKIDVESAELAARTVEGRNISSIAIAKSDSLKDIESSNAERDAEIAKATNAGKAREAEFTADTLAENKRAENESARLKADVLVPANINKEERLINAKALAESTIEEARGNSEAILLKNQAEADGIEAILKGRAEGLRAIVEAAGSSEDAVKLLLVDKLPELMRIQADAIANIKIDKVTVWDSGNGGTSGQATPDFIKGMLGAIPGFSEVYKDLGLKLPGMLEAKDIEDAVEVDGEESKKDEFSKFKKEDEPSNVVKIIKGK